MLENKQSTSNLFKLCYLNRKELKELKATNNKLNRELKRIS